jgi:hypothetical protein
MTAPDDLSVLRTKPFSDALEKFEKLLVQSGRAFLIGAGCSKCAGLPLTAELTTLATDSEKLDASSKAILAAIRNLFDGATNSHIEDYLSELVDLLAIAQRRTERGAAHAQVTIGGSSYSAAQLRAAADQIKQAISTAIDKKVEIEVHRAFVAAVHRPLRVGKTAASSVVDYLVLNYDTIVEDALALERIPFSDGIDGGVTGWWSNETFDRDGLSARVLKLHGSVNWCEVAGDPLPRRIAPSLNVQDMRDRQVLIWPASTKYRETQLDPFAQLAERARLVMRPFRGSQRVLVVCGYSFGDAHINIEIDRALRESAGNLTVIAFSSEDAPMGKLKEWHESPEVRDQVLIFAKRGFFHGNIAEVSAHDLPWWKFENVVRLLEDAR